MTMPPRPQRLIRRQSLSQRIRARLNPGDFYLWLSEEIQTFNWDSSAFGTRFGLLANLVFLTARANVSGLTSTDDVFGDGPSSSWVPWMANLCVWTLISLSMVNAWFTMTRSRHYRLFEKNAEEEGPSTPSARRVRVDSLPASSSPLRLVQDLLGAESAESRAYPNKTRDVWEMAVWDPFPATLQLFCLFSPGHVAIHMLFLPVSSKDPRPSVAILKCLALQLILSAQLLLLQSGFSRQAKDTAIIQREVLHEYDTKYVHPRLHPKVRCVSTQVAIGDEGDIDDEFVSVGTPSTIIRRGFQTHPNTNYAKHYDTDPGQTVTPSKSRGVMATEMFTPPVRRVPDPHLSSLYSSAHSRPSGLRQSVPAQTARHRHEYFATSTETTAARPSYGGSLGVYSHVNSPLKKATSMGNLDVPFSPRNSREMAALEQRDLAERMIRQASPIKDNRRATTQFGNNGYLHSPTLSANAKASRWQQERYPSLRL